MRGLGLENMDIRCAVSGPCVEAARAAAQELVRQGARALICVGVSGGLLPGLAPADLVLAESVLLDGPQGGANFRTSTAWGRQALAAILAAEHADGPRPRTLPGRVLSIGRPALTPARKEDLWRRTRAAVADLESAGVAMVAAEESLPLLVLRAVCDPPWRELPPELPRLLDARGRVRPGRFVASLARKPRLMADLLASHRDFRAATASLRWAMEALVRSGALLPPRV